MLSGFIWLLIIFRVHTVAHYFQGSCGCLLFSGFFLCRHYEYMLGKLLKDMYHDFLTNDNAPIKLRCQVLKNLQLYLVEEEITMSKSDAECE